MPLQVRDFGPRDPIYTFVAPDGTNTNIAAALLRLHCLGLDQGPITNPKPRYEVQMFPVRKELASQFLRDNVISQSRMLELLDKDTLDPIIVCADGHFTNGAPDVMLVDGHHRYCLAAAMSLDWIPCFLLEPHQWEPFRIEGCRPITESLLRSIPITPRSY